MRIGISLALSALLAHTMYAQEVCSSTNGSDKTINAGDTCTINSTNPLTINNGKLVNNGTIITNSGAKITFSSTDSAITVSSDDNNGVISVKGTTTFDASANNGNGFTIEGQKIDIASSISLVLKSTKITLGAENKLTSITGNSTSVSSTTTWGVTLDSTTELDTKNVDFKNIRLTGSTFATLKNTASTLSNAHIISTASSGLTLSADSGSTFTLIGESNTISAGTNALNIQGEHTFSGSGILDFVGGTITLGESETTKLTLKNSSSAETPTLGFSAETKVLFSNVESSGLTLQIIKSGSSATLHNVSSTFKGGTLQAIDRDNKDQVLVIENGQSALQKQAGITISANNQDTVTTFKGSGIEIYGQEITINGDTTHKNTLNIQTIDAQGDIILGKENSVSNQDGYITIKGGENNNKFLQLQGVSTTIGGEVTLQNLQVSTYAKNTQEDEGMIFSLSDGSTLTLNNVTLTSGIDTNYQDLSFTTLEGTSTLKITTADSSIKASSLSFTNQKIDLSSAGSGKALNLYSYGNVALTSTTGSGVGNFAFTDTTITDGSGAKLNLYSNGGAKVLASNLTLNNLTLTTYKINGSSSEKNAIDLSDAGSNLITQGSVTIDTKEFLYGDTQGIGMDITIQGGSDGSGKLTLKSDTGGDSFTFGGTLTIDNSSATSGKPNGASSQIDITLGATQDGVQTQSDSTVDWYINGGLTAIGNANPTSIITTSGTSTTTTLKAKSFTFGAGSIVSSINGTLSLSADGGGSNNIDLSQALTLLQGVSSAEATISKGTGTLTIGDVIATGKTKIESATFSNSNIKIRSIDSNANTLTITSTNAVSGIQSIDIADANLSVQNGSSQELQLNVNGSITSNGTSTITASTIKAGSDNNGTYSINVESGTLTLKETTSAGDAIGSLTLGTEGKQGGSLILTNNTSSTYHTFKAPSITSYNDSSITADTFEFSNNSASIFSTDGELKLLSKKTSPNGNDTLTIQDGEITLDNGSLSYYYTNSSETLGKMKLHNTSTSVSIASTGTSSIKAQELSLSGNTITSSGGVLTLQGLKGDSTLGAVTINNAGGLTITEADNTDLASVKLSSTLTLTANAPYVSSSSPLGGGKFGVLQAKSVNFTQDGGSTSPLIHIQVMDKPLEGEELFTLTEGGQVVVWTTNGITKGTATGAKQSSTAITLDDISIDNGGYKSLTLSAELVPDSTTSTQVNAIKVLLSVAQSSASELTEGISDTTAKNQMQTLLSSGDNKEIIDSILGSSTNPLKVGFAENIAQGNVVVVGNALNYIDDTFKSVAESIHLNDRVQTQIYLSQIALTESRMARHNNPHQNSSELLGFIRSYHNTAYASNDDSLLAPEESEEQTSHKGKGSLWVSYDGGLATGNSSNSTINGISAGYDHAINSSYLVGGFVNYAYGAFDGTYLHNTSHNIGLGLYSRMYFGDNEVDLIFSQNIGLVTSDINVGNTTMPSLLNGVMEYNLYRTNVLARYGYSFKVGEEESPYYLKPLVGVGMSYTYQEGSESNAVASITMNEASLFKLEVSVGMEMRKYINEGTYFFVMPLIERELYGSSCDRSVGFVDSANLNYSLDYQSQTGIALYAGGEGNLTENLALSGSVGVKVGIEKSEVLTNWSVGLKYKF